MHLCKIHNFGFCFGKRQADLVRHLLSFDRMNSKYEKMSLGDREAESVAFKHDAVQIHGAWLPEPFKRPLMSPCPLVQRLQLVIAWKQRHYNVIHTFDTEDAPFKYERDAFCGKMFTDLALNCFQISVFFLDRF